MICAPSEEERGLVQLVWQSHSAFTGLFHQHDVQVDKPTGADAYKSPHVGGYKLQGGQLLTFPQATAGPIMLVSLQAVAPFN